MQTAESAIYSGFFYPTVSRRAAEFLFDLHSPFIFLSLKSGNFGSFLKGLFTASLTQNGHLIQRIWYWSMKDIYKAGPAFQFSYLLTAFLNSVKNMLT